MAEATSTNTIVPVDGEYILEVKEFDAAGKSKTLAIAAPKSPDFNSWSLMQMAVMLKKGPWQARSLQEIIYAIAYAHNLGLDIMQGDVYPTGDGRINTSNKAKIKQALATGMIEGIQVDIKDTAQAITLDGCPQKTDLECTVTVHVKGWKVPIVRTSRLSRWYNKANPNWKGRPEHMLELNTVAHALEYVHPTATESDETPPPAAPINQG